MYSQIGATAGDGDGTGYVDSCFVMPTVNMIVVPSLHNPRTMLGKHYHLTIGSRGWGIIGPVTVELLVTNRRLEKGDNLPRLYNYEKYCYG